MAINLKYVNFVTSKVLFWLCFVALNALALSPPTYLPLLEVFSWWDKAQHAIGFGALAVLAALAYPHVSMLRMGVLLCLQGVAIEVLQHWGGLRFGDWQDAVADAVGVVLGLGLAALYKLAAQKIGLPKEVRQPKEMRQPGADLND